MTAAAAPCLSLVVSPAAQATVDCLEPGSRLKVLDRSEDWLAVRLADGRLGWVLAPCLPLYTSPDEASERLDQCLAPEEPAEVLAVDGDWQVVRLTDSRLAWAHGRAPLAPIETTKSEPVAAASPAPPAPQAPTEATPVPAPPAIEAAPPPVTRPVAPAPVPATPPPASAAPPPAAPEPAAPASPAPVEAPTARRAPAPDPTPVEPAAAAAATLAAPATPVYRVDPGDSSCLNVREGPGAQRGTMACLPRGATVEVVDSAGDWLAITLPDGRTGWAAASYLVREPAGAMVRRTAGRAGSLFEVAPTEAYCLNIRSAASADSRLLACLPRGEVVEATELDGSWLAFRLPDGRTGWTIVRALQEIAGPAGPIETVTEPAAVARVEQPAAAAVPPAPEPEEPAAQAPAQPRVQAREAAPAPAAEPEPAAEAGAGRFEISTTLESCLNVRPSPSTRKPPLTCLAPGTRVDVVDNYGSWSAVRFAGDQVGWVVASYLTELPEPEPPVLTAARAEQPGAAEGPSVEARAPAAPPSAPPEAGQPGATAETERRREDERRPAVDPRAGERRPSRRPLFDSRRRGPEPSPPPARQPAAATPSTSIATTPAFSSVATAAPIPGLTCPATSCSAGELAPLTAAVTNVIDGCTSAADTATLEITFMAGGATMPNRYDLAFWIETDPSTMTCSAQYCEPEDLDGNPMTGSNCVAVDTGDPAGTCFDYDSPNKVTFVRVETVPCKDTSPADGNLDDVNTWISWEQNVNHVCNPVNPGTPAKCNLKVVPPGVPVPTTTTTTTSTTTTSTTTTSTTTTSTTTTTTTTTTSTTTTSTTTTTTSTTTSTSTTSTSTTSTSTTSTSTTSTSTTSTSTTSTSTTSTSTTSTSTTSTSTTSTSTTSTSTTSTSTTSTSTTSTTTTTLPPPGFSLALAKTASPSQVAPGGQVTYVIRVTNNTTASTARGSVSAASGASAGDDGRSTAQASSHDDFTLKKLTDDKFGDLNGKGSCALPRSIPAGGFYECSFTATVPGTAGQQHINTVTAEGDFPGTPPVTRSAQDVATVEIAEVAPSLSFWWRVTLFLLVTGLGAGLLSRRQQSS